MTTLAVLSCLIWIYLLTAHGRFWQSGPVLRASRPLTAPAVAVIVPARDEAPGIEASLGSLLAQDYPGPYRVILVDDGSTDGTGDIARRLDDPQLLVISGQPRLAGWSGKLWAIAQGLAEMRDEEFALLTDADIVHEPAHVSTLVAQAERGGFDLVSEMVMLSCESLAERALVPAFVYFFQLLYPFVWVNDPMRATAAAAGGTILIRRRALQRIGGIEAVSGALIDDVALAAAVKLGGRIWLGHSSLARSVRQYPAFADIWQMIARTAYVQLRFSPLLLAITTFGMFVVFVVPAVSGSWFGLVAYVMMAGSYLPTLARFGRSYLWALVLPLIAVFYMAATVGAASDHYRGLGVRWKGRAYG